MGKRPLALLSGLVLALLWAVMLPGGGARSSAPAVVVPGQVTFAAAGDFSASTAAGQVLDTVRGLGTGLTLALGDLSYDPADNEQAWCDFVTGHVGAGYPFELIAGNHESNGQDGDINDYSACLPNQLPGLVGTYGRQWYVDVPADAPLVRYVMISPDLAFPEGTYDYGAGSPRYQWTVHAIDQARTAGIPWVVVGMHKPCLSVGDYGCDPGADLLNMLVDKRVDLVLSGHEHLYQRTGQLDLGASCPQIAPGTYDGDCMVDADTSMTAGAGTVLATVGTGGRSLRAPNLTDPEAAYFVAVSGADREPSHGVLAVTATPETFSGRFVAAGQGTFTDTFTITRSAGPVNQAPTAAFTHQVDGLSLSVDATGSTDDDGTVTGYSWSWGDGSPTASGATASHDYAASGSYTVALTVTDDQGADNTLFRSVQVSSGQTGAVAADAFERTVTGGWGSADAGGAWTTQGPASGFSVGGGAGLLRLGAGSLLGAVLGQVSVTDADLTATVSVDKTSTGSGAYVQAIGRDVAGTGSYRVQAAFRPNGEVRLLLLRRAGSGAQTLLGPSTLVPSTTYAPGDRFRVRLLVSGTGPTELRAKLWRVGDAEPTGWLVTATDATAAYQAAGSVGIGAILSSRATNAPVTVAVDDFAVGSVS